MAARESGRIPEEGAQDHGAPERRGLSRGAAAKAIGVSFRTLQRWEQSGRLVPASRSDGGHARYSTEQVESCREKSERSRGSAPSGESTTSTGTTQAVDARSGYL